MAVVEGEASVGWAVKLHQPPPHLILGNRLGHRKCARVNQHSHTRERVFP